MRVTACSTGEVMTNQFLDVRFLTDHRSVAVTTTHSSLGPASVAAAAHRRQSANIAYVAARRFEARPEIAHALYALDRVSKQIMLLRTYTSFPDNLMHGTWCATPPYSFRIFAEESTLFGTRAPKLDGY